MESEQQIPIWFFIGIMLLAYGVLITGSGLYLYASPPPVEQQVKLFEYHVDIWWGLLMAAVGLIYCWKFHPWREQQPEVPAQKT